MLPEFEFYLNVNVMKLSYNLDELLFSHCQASEVWVRFVHEGEALAVAHLKAPDGGWGAESSFVKCGLVDLVTNIVSASIYE